MGFSSSVHRTSLLFVLAIPLFVAGCMPQSSGSNETPPRPQTAEKAYAGTPTVYGGSTTQVTATATFSRFDDGPTGLATVSTGHAIRFAEFHIFDAAGNRIQQGETDGSGAISALIPLTNGDYVLAVNSRADNNNYRVSVLDNPYDQNYYSLRTPFTVSGQGSLAVTITSAPAGNSTTLEGGAFNILDQIYIANEFLRVKANDTTNCAMCSTDFVAAPKIPIYWTKGLTPATYYGAPSSAISFFISQQSGSIYRGLYILGGIQGNVCTDTDHFDRSVILHEYAHFLESAYSKTASPGGSHNGDDVIDPRLAWSEGWANFFQAMALGRSIYRDTVRNSACSGGNAMAFPDFNLEVKAGRDVPSANEGIFREISISRMLYDSATGTSLGAAYNLNADSDTYYGDVGFGLVWHSFKAMANSIYKFQNAGIFNSLMAGYLNGGGFTNTQITRHENLTDYENSARNQNLFGRKLNVTPGGSCTFSFAYGTPEQEDVSNNVVVYSHYLNNNGFFRYDYDGNPANALISLRYSGSGMGSAPYDLDLFAYTEKYTFLDGGDLAKYSTVAYPEFSGNPIGQEFVDLTGQPAGTYMINVKVDYTATRQTTTYYFNVGNSGARLCP